MYMTFDVKELTRFLNLGSCSRHRERERDKRRHPRAGYRRTVGRGEQRRRGRHCAAGPHGLGQRVPGRQVQIHLSRSGKRKI